MRARGFGWQRTLPGLVVGVAGVTGVIWALQPVVPAPALAGLYVLAVLPVAVLWGVWPALIVAVVSALTFDFFFFPPLFGLTPTDPHIAAILVISAVTAVVVSALAGRMRRRAGEAESLARDVRRIAEEQAALRRVATLVARAASPEEVFAAVAAEVRRVLAVDLTVMCRYDPDGVLTYVGWSQSGNEGPIGVRVPLGGRNVARLVFETGRPARIDDYGDASGPAADVVRPLGLRSAVGVPVSVAGRLWGVMTVASMGEQPPPAGIEDRLAGFTEQVATAIANAQARVELRGFAEEQAALHRVATLVAQAASPEEVFGAVAAEAGRLLGVDFTILRRFEDDEQVSVGTWSSGAGDGDPFPVGTRVRLGGRNVVSLVFETGRPARIDDYSDASGPVAEAARGWGLRSAVGVPISVEGRLWGVVAAAYMHDEPLPVDTEARLGGFAELVATAIANAQARVELRGFAEEQATLRRVATLVARAAPPHEVFAAVTEEAGRLLEVDFMILSRFENGEQVSVGAWSGTGDGVPFPVGTRVDLGGRNVVSRVVETGRPARIDDYVDASGPVADAARGWGLRSAVGVPVSVEGQLWGVIAAASAQDQPLPADTEARLAAFTELVATAIANAQARVELRGFAEEQAALRRVATLVARAASPEEVFAAVTEEAGRVLHVDFTSMARYDPDGAITWVGSWSATDTAFPIPLGTRAELGGRNMPTLVFETDRPARIDYADASGEIADVAHEVGVRSSVGAPISVEGRLWGVLAAVSTHDEPLPVDTEARLGGFAELVATAIANAQARVELRGFAEEQAALRRVATLVARAASPEEVFASVTAEVGRVLCADVATMSRYDPDGEAMVLGLWTRTGTALPVQIGTRAELGGRNATTLVFQTRRPTRIDDYADASGAWAADVARKMGVRSSVGAPISVEGRLWGAMIVSLMREEPLAADTEVRLAAFTELVATALANAQAQAALTASRARIVAAADSTRRRIERDLHDGAQQRLVSLALQLRTARAAVPSELGELRTQLDFLATEVNGTLDELRQLARGIHPPALARGGLCPALNALARRSAVPADLDIRVDGRLPEQIEIGAYFVVSEALTNAAKHSEASNVHVEVLIVEGDLDAVLRVRIRDDGRGGADLSGGSGLIGLKDRVEALGGALSVQTAPGAGSCVQAELPLRVGRAVSG